MVRGLAANPRKQNEVTDTSPMVVSWGWRKGHAILLLRVVMCVWFQYRALHIRPGYAAHVAEDQSRWRGRNILVRQKKFSFTFVCLGK